MSANVDRFSYYFTVKFRKNLQRNVNVKLPPPLKSVAALPCETQWSAIQQYIHISDNNMLDVRQYLFHEFLFYLFILPDTDVIMTLLQSFLLHYSFRSVMKINIWHSIEQRTIDASIDQWHSRLKTYVLKVDILNTRHKLICVEKQINSISREHLPHVNIFSSL